MNRLHLDLNRAPGIFPSWRAFWRAVGTVAFFALLIALAVFS